MHETEALHIRRLTAEDLEPLHRLLSDPAVMRYLEPPFTRAQTEAFLQKAGMGREPLIRAVEEGYQATAFFVIQMENVLDFAPNDDTDPAFGQALRQAARAGVEIAAYSCRVTPGSIEMDRPVPVLL